MPLVLNLELNKTMEITENAQSNIISQELCNHLHQDCCYIKKGKSTKKLDTEKFIIRSKYEHGDKLGYDRAKYINFTTPIELFCFKCKAYFWQTPRENFAGCGCSNCGGTKKHTIEEFILLWKGKYGSLFDYGLSDYKNNKTPIEIFCTLHNLYFYQTPKEHLKGKGCPQCRKNIPLTTEIFIERANKVKDNKNKCGYGRVKYIDFHSKVEILCNIHNEYFWQSASSHLSGKGYPKCNKSNKSNTEEFIIKSRNVNGDKCGYDRTIYVDFSTPVELFCNFHKTYFLRTPEANLKGRCCPTCSRSISQKEIAWIASLNNPNIKKDCRIYIDKKLIIPDGFDETTNTMYEFYGDYWHGNCSKFDPNKMNYSVKKTFIQLYNATMKREALIKSAGYNLVAIWESDYEDLNIAA